MRLNVEKGLIQVYTGDGKGKTTAAVGQGIRAMGRGNRVIMIQFLKSSHTGELTVLKRLEPHFRVFRFEKERGFIWTLSSAEIEELRQEVEAAFKFAGKVLENRECELLILDEIMAVLGNHLLAVDEVVRLLRDKPREVEIILTGRNVPREIAEIADYVSEIACVKHPYQQGIAAREGIEF